MNSLLEPFRELMRRRLLPVALLLVGMAAAMPLLLSDQEELEPLPAAAPTGAAALQAAIVTAAGEAPAPRHRVLGSRKDPFTPTGRQPKRTTAKAEAAPAAVQTATDLSGAAPAGDAGGMPAGVSASSGGGGAAPGGGGLTPGGGGGDTGAGGGDAAPPVLGPPTPAQITPEPTVPADPGSDETYAMHSLKVNYDGEERIVERLDPLPDADNPAVIYLGLLENTKTAVLLLDEGVTTEGDGSCHPSPEDCQRVYLKAGETQFVQVPGEDGSESEEHQIDLLKVHTKRTKSGVAAAASANPDGRRALRDRIDRVGRLRFNPRTGKLRSLTHRGWRAAIARAAATAER